MQKPRTTATVYCLEAKPLPQEPGRKLYGQTASTDVCTYNSDSTITHEVFLSLKNDAHHWFL